MVKDPPWLIPDSRDLFALDWSQLTNNCLEMEIPDGAIQMARKLLHHPSAKSLEQALGTRRYSEVIDELRSQCNCEKLKYLARRYRRTMLRDMNFAALVVLRVMKLQANSSLKNTLVSEERQILVPSRH